MVSTTLSSRLIHTLTPSVVALCPLQLEGMSGLLFLRVFNLALCWETAWVGKSNFWLRKLANQHITIAEIKALSNVLSDCPEFNEINVSIHFGNTSIRDPTQFLDSAVSVVDWKRCLKMCKMMDEPLSRLQSETFGFFSFTFNMQELEVIIPLSQGYTPSFCNCRKLRESHYLRRTQLKYSGPEILFRDCQ